MFNKCKLLVFYDNSIIEFFKVFLLPVLCIEKYYLYIEFAYDVTIYVALHAKLQTKNTRNCKIFIKTSIEEINSINVHSSNLLYRACNKLLFF